MIKQKCTFLMDDKHASETNSLNIKLKFNFLK